MKKFRFTRILLIIVAVLAVAYGLSPLYLRNAIFYQKPDLDDYTIFNNRVVMAGGYQPWSEVPGYQAKTISTTYSKQFDKLKTVGYLVIKNDQLVFEKYWKGYDADTKLNSFNMAGSIISLLVGVAMDEGMIKSVDQPVGEFLPDYRTGEKARITIRHLLEMSAGLNWEESYSGLTSMTTQGYYGDELAKLVVDQHTVREPGLYFEYKSGNTQLLALVLESATGRKVSSYASEKLWIPMGAKSDALWSTDRPNGIEKAFACFHSTTRDFARFGQLIVNQGKWNDRQLVSDMYLADALRPDTLLTDEVNKKVDYYGWHWWLMKYRGHQVYYMMGLNGQYVIAIPELKTVIVRFGKKCSLDKIRGIPADFFTWVDAGLELSGS